jgi:transketolase
MKASFKPMGTREVFFNTLTKLMEKDSSIVFITGDLGYPFLEPLSKKFPDRVLNIGTMEQTMVGVACGMARAGLKPYVYSTVNFLLFRALEQVRNDVVYQKMNVKLIGISMSGFLGMSHNLLHKKEDINLCKNIGLKSYTPKLKEVEKIIIKTYKENKPSYVRL